MIYRIVEENGTVNIDEKIRRAGERSKWRIKECVILNLSFKSDKILLHFLQ